MEWCSRGSRHNAGIPVIAFALAFGAGGPGASIRLQAPPDAEPAVLVGAGDIANCQIANGAGAAATASLLDRIPGTVFTVGDHAYPSGTSDEFHDCYEPRWGRHKARTRPAPGNHDYLTASATAVLRLLRRERRQRPPRLLQLHAGVVARRVVEQLDLRRSSLAADRVAAARSRRAPLHVYARVLAHPRVQLGTARNAASGHHMDAGGVEGPL